MNHFELFFVYFNDTVKLCNVSMRQNKSTGGPKRFFGANIPTFLIKYSSCSYKTCPSISQNSLWKQERVTLTSTKESNTKTIIEPWHEISNNVAF